jgi:hypothetical protein
LSSAFYQHLFDGGPEPLAIDRAVARTKGGVSWSQRGPATKVVVF